MNSSRQKIFKFDDYPSVELSDQYMRDLTDVYRRDKDFLKHKILMKTEEETAPIYYIKEQCHNIPCNCEISTVRRLFQSTIVMHCSSLKRRSFFSQIDLIGGIKMSIEFFLFMGYTIKRRDELLECHYPFVPRTTYSNEMKNSNTLRHQFNQKPRPIKHTIIDTYCDIH
jgi:hypothetical protein